MEKKKHLKIVQNVDRPTFKGDLEDPKKLDKELEQMICENRSASAADIKEIWEKTARCPNFH